MYLPFLSKSLTLCWVCHRRSSRLRDENYVQVLQALTRQISDLRLHGYPGQVTEASSSGTNPQCQALALTQEIGPTSNSKKNNVLALGFKHNTQTAFTNFSDNTAPSIRSGRSTKYSPSKLLLFSKRVKWQDDMVVQTIFGTFRRSSRISQFMFDQPEGPTCSEEEDRFEYQTIFRLILPSWMARLGLNFIFSGRCSSSPLSGPTVGLEVARSVPDNAVIFDLCKEGNLGDVQALLNTGQASAKDVDSKGRTPLYVSSNRFSNAHAIPQCMFQRSCSMFLLTIPSMP